MTHIRSAFASHHIIIIIITSSSSSHLIIIIIPSVLPPTESVVHQNDGNARWEFSASTWENQKQIARWTFFNKKQKKIKREKQSKLGIFNSNHWPTELLLRDSTAPKNIYFDKRERDIWCALTSKSINLCQLWGYGHSQYTLPPF